MQTMNIYPWITNLNLKVNCIASGKNEKSFLDITPKTQFIYEKHDKFIKWIRFIMKWILTKKWKLKNFSFLKDCSENEFTESKYLQSTYLKKTTYISRTYKEFSKLRKTNSVSKWIMDVNRQKDIWWQICTRKDTA